MTDSNDLATLLGGRLLALDRGALPALTAKASLRLAETGGLAHAQRQHASLMDEFAGGELRVSRVGSTAVVPLVGFITTDRLLAWLVGGTSPDALVRALRTAIADRDVTDVILLVDSPGGEVTLIPETAAEIRRLGAIKPITAMARTCMCSAAYWLACQASVVIATPSADVGSLGCFIMHAEESRLLDKIGITVTYVANAPEKVEGNSEEPLTDEAHAFIRQRVMDCYAAFFADVVRGRRTTEANVRANYGRGRFYGAAESLRRGLVDRVATIETLLPAAGGRPGRAALSEAIQIDLQDCDNAIAIRQRQNRALGVPVDDEELAAYLRYVDLDIHIRERQARD